MEPQIKYAGFWLRTVAFMVDITVVLFVAMILFVASLFLGEKYFVIVSLIAPLGGWAYLIIMTNKYQATVGKMMVGIKVVAQDGTKLSLKKVMFREIVGRFVSGLFLIGYITVAFTKDKQGFHDMLTGSMVVYKDPAKKPGAIVWIVGGIGLVLFVGTFILGIFISFILPPLADSFHGSNYEAMKTSDTAIKQGVITALSNGIMYYSQHQTLVGYTASSTAEGCPLITMISPEGKKIAVFGKECQMPDSYFCADADFTTGKINKGTYVTEAQVSEALYSCTQ